MHVYYGTVLYYEGDTSEALSYVELTRQELIALIGKQLDSVKDHIQTDCYDVLKVLENSIVDFAAFRTFPLIER